MCKISFYLFAIHSFIRVAFFGLICEEKIVEQNLEVPVGILYLLTSILIAYIFQQLLNRIYNYCQTKIIHKNSSTHSFNQNFIFSLKSNPSLWQYVLRFHLSKESFQLLLIHLRLSESKAVRYVPEE